MRTRRGVYPTLSDGITFSIRPALQKRSRQSNGCLTGGPNKRARLALSTKASINAFDALHDDLLVSIMVAVSSTATSPADLVNSILVSKRFCAAAVHPQVLASASTAAFAVKASRWSDGAQRFLKQCAKAGNADACYILGMVCFYCLQNRIEGASMIAKAAISSHSHALHSLAVIQFNGSGGTRKDKNLKAGVSLCARAASLGHVDAMRELGHCLQDGYGVTKNVSEGRRLLLEANAREAAAAMAASPRTFLETALQLAAQSTEAGCSHHHLHCRFAITKLQALAGNCAIAPNNITNTTMDQERQSVYRLLHGGVCSLLSDFGCNVPPPKLHIANQFLADWFAMQSPASGLRLCSHANCGRPETRRLEFRRCSACGRVNYCSRACQALDWKLRHKHDCLVGAAEREGRGEQGEEDEQEAAAAAVAMDEDDHHLLLLRHHS
eukprot:c29681_g1_i1 orf=102-1421(-)